MIYSSQQNKWVNLQDSFRGQNARPEPPVEVPPESVPAFQAHLWPDNHLGVDIRPHVWDKESSQFLLIDSGSQCTAFPPDPGDREVKGVFLKAVNGTRIKCYGFKSIKKKLWSHLEGIQKVSNQHPLSI